MDCYICIKTALPRDFYAHKKNYRSIFASSSPSQHRTHRNHVFQNVQSQMVVHEVMEMINIGSSKHFRIINSKRIESGYTLLFYIITEFGMNLVYYFQHLLFSFVSKSFNLMS